MDPLHIAFFGATNSGKSTLVNAIAGQEVSLVSEKPGTTTDPVRKRIELPYGIGPAVLVDTAGYGDEGTLGAERERLTRSVLDSTDVAVLLRSGHPADAVWEEMLERAGIPVVVTEHPATVENTLRRIAQVLPREEKRFLTGNLVRPGDKVIIQPPVYDHFRLYIERMGRVAVDNPMIEEDGKYRMDFEGLEKLFDERTKVLLLCNPHNPCGILWDKDTLVKLAEICRRHGVIVISDEIHGDLALYGRRHTPFCSVSDDAKEIGVIFAGPTKAFNLAGLSGTAFCIIPEKEKREKYLSLLKNSKLYEPSIMTIVPLIAAYRQDTRWLSSLKRYIEGNISVVEKFFNDGNTGIRALRPQASFLVWLDCRALGLPQEELMDFFRKEAKIIPSDGSSYGQGGEGFVRLNVGCPRATLDEALSRIRRAFGK